MAETVHAAQVDEHPVIGDIGNGTRNHLAFHQVGLHIFPKFFAFVFEDGAAGDYHIVALAVIFEHFEIKGLADEVVQIFDRSQIDLRIRQEGRYADIDRKATLDPIVNSTGNGAVRFLDLGDIFPDLDTDGFFAREFQAAFGLSFLYQDIKYIAYLDVDFAIFVFEFGAVDLTFRLVADIYNDIIVDQGDNGAGYDFTHLRHLLTFLKKLSKAHFPCIDIGLRCGCCCAFCHRNNPPLIDRAYIPENMGKYKLFICWLGNRRSRKIWLSALAKKSGITI